MQAANSEAQEPTEDVMDDADAVSYTHLIIANETDIIDVYDPQLTLKGLRMIYEKNKR